MQTAEIRELSVALAEALRAEVVPHLGAHAGREHVESSGEAGRGAGGDVTFAIDERAEALMETYLGEHAPGVAFYSEDRGMVNPQGSDPDWVLVVDPIDGTRPALAGLESSCVSVAAARLDSEPTMGDVEVGVVIELRSGARFVAERGAGVEPKPQLSPNTEIGRMFWTYGLRGRPTMMLMGVLSELVDASSVGGASFDLGSATFDMTRIATGQLDAYVEPGPRIVEEIAGGREAFERVGGGEILNNSPYDLAAAALILTEGGAFVTDASGASLSNRKLLGSGHDFQMSCIATGSRELHTAICAAIDSGIERLAKASQ